LAKEKELRSGEPEFFEPLVKECGCDADFSVAAV
jgi:hypothetical protein